MARPQLNFSALAAILALLFVTFAGGAEAPRASAVRHVVGEKLDSGLGELPHYCEWAHHPATRKLAAATGVPGEKLDSGLGALPHYREWAYYPATRKLAAATVASGEMLDGGRGEPPQYRVDRR